MKILTTAKEKQLEKIANLIRQDIIKMIGAAGSGHPGGSLGCTEIFTLLYFHLLRHRPKQPSWPKRDRLVLSNGHIAPVRYAAMARSGYFPLSWLKSLRKLGSPLQGHPALVDLPGVESSGGPLAQGSAVACGMALAAKMNKETHRIYCVMSDGELNEGASWEALMLGAKYRLNNLTAIIDRNNIQIDGFSDEVMPLEPLADKLKAFNWKVITVDGHNLQQLFKAVNQAASEKNKPTAIIAKTIPGKGVSFMENKFAGHGVAPKSEQVEAALKELQK